MSTRKITSNPAIVLPLWQVILVLVGLPALYIANSFLPWSIALLRRHDHAFFFQFWASIAVLHWGSVSLVLFMLKRVGRRLPDIGLILSPLNVAMIVGMPLILGLALTMLSEPRPETSAVLPSTRGERLFWIFISFTAGFCEELIYRGFNIRILQGRTVRTWLAVGLATLAFVLMHGISVLALSPFLTISIGGLLFTILFLWRRSLVPGICLHALIDVANIGVPG